MNNEQSSWLVWYERRKKCSMTHDDCWNVWACTRFNDYWQKFWKSLKYPQLHFKTRPSLTGHCDICTIVVNKTSHAWLSDWWLDEKLLFFFNSQELDNIQELIQCELNRDAENFIVSLMWWWSQRTWTFFFFME